MTLPLLNNSGTSSTEQQSTGLYPSADSTDLVSTLTASTSPWPSPTFQQFCPLTPSKGDTSESQSHISAGLGSNGHLIRRLYLYNTQLAHIFDHPNISQLTDFTCILMPSTPSLVHVEDILARNISHRLQRLKMGRSSTGRRRIKEPTHSRDIGTSGETSGSRATRSGTGSSERRSHRSRNSRHRSEQGPSAKPYHLLPKQHLQDEGHDQHTGQNLNQGDSREPSSRHIPSSYIGSTFQVCSTLSH